jgi:pSer/pThr/pTyr-binding forkhead associated (FHA) protein
MITCGRCGLQNRADLRFCADCGARLAAPSAVAASAPPRNVRESAEQSFASTHPSRPQARPVAPALDFGPGTPAPAAATASLSCRQCGATNTPEARFCTACGHPMFEERGARSSTPARQPEPAIVCSRCHGSSPPGTLYCQFCGARLQPEAVPQPSALARAEPSAASAPEPPASLIVIAQDGTPGAEHPLIGPVTEIGREQGGILLAGDPYVSPRHLRLSRRNGRFFVRDLESVNGVYVRLRGPEALRHGDLVLVGLEVLRFELVSDAERGLGPATERGTRVFGSPSVPRHARLCQMTVEGAPRDVYYLSRDETVIGRESGDVVFTSDPFMSRRHASVERDQAASAFTLRDLGSSNGTYLAIRDEHEVSNGDYLRVGQHLFRLDVGRARR